MNKELKELIKLLPTKWSRWTAGSSLLLSVVAYNLSTLLPLSGEASQPFTLFLLRISLFMLTLLFGALIIIIIISKHSNLLQSKIDNIEQVCEARIAEIKQAADPINNLKPGEALITENVFSGNPIIKKVNLPM
ncbi:MAG: hypothetical protein ACYDA7_06925 [Acidithiobacillus sp.]